MHRKLIYYGNPLLRKKSEEIKEITDETRQLAKEMIEVMDRTHGVGLAAVQIGVLLRIFVCNIAREPSPDGAYVIEKPKVYINPVVTILDDTQWVDSEGCLSIPKLYEEVPRPTKIRVEALDEWGKPFAEEREGWAARPILHENDHLNGVLFFDRIPEHRKKALQPQLKKIKKQYHQSTH